MFQQTLFININHYLHRPGWKIPGDLVGTKLTCGKKEELKAAWSGGLYRLNIGNEPHDLVRFVALNHKAPLLLEFAAPRQNGRPPTLEHMTVIMTWHAHTAAASCPARSRMKHFWACSGVPEPVQASYKASRAKRQWSTAPTWAEPGAHPAHACEYGAAAGSEPATQTCSSGSGQPEPTAQQQDKVHLPESVKRMIADSPMNLPLTVWEQWYLKQKNDPMWARCFNKTF